MEHTSQNLFTFKAGDNYYLFTPENVSVYQIPPHYHEMAKMWGSPREEMVKAFSPQFDENAINKAIEKIAALADYHKTLPGDKNSQEECDSCDSKDEAFSLKEVHLQVSHYCNLNCKYCYADGGSYGKEAVMMNKETAKRAVDFFVENLPRGIVGDLSFDGGEPLTNWEIIQYAVEYGQQKAKEEGKNLFFYIGTNGTLLNKKKFAYIKEKKIGVGVSIDGDQDTHDANRKFNNNKGSYNTIARNIREFVKEVGPENLQARGTITRHNLNVTGTVKHLLSIGIRHIYLDPVSSTEPKWQLTEEELEIIKQEFSKLADFYVDSLLQRKFFIIRNFSLFIKRIHFKRKLFYKCGVGRNGIAITPLGEIFPCYRFTSVPSYRMGSIFEEGVDPDFRHQFIENHVQKRSGCQTCWARYICGGGCPYHAIYKQGSISKNDDQECSFILNMIQLSIEIYVRVKQKDPSFWDHFFKMF